MSKPAYPNSGTLGKNKRQRPGTKDPEYAGQATVNGVDYWVNAWVKEGPTGKFFSLAFKEKDPGAYNPATAPATEAPPIADEDVPF